MGQVPPNAGAPAKHSERSTALHHLLIGGGKLARHFARYFEALGLSHESWRESRTFTPDRVAAFAGTHVWFLVSDDAIAEVARRFRDAHFGEELVYLHASGARVVEGVIGAHPLMTFGPELYAPETYARVPFVVEDVRDGRTATEILGGLPNAAVFLPAEKRALYHSLVVSSGNFPALLWTEVFALFERRLGLPAELLAPFLFQTLTNTLEAGERSLTGPLVRGDRATIREHRAALAGTPLAELYRAFEKFFADSRSAPKGNDHVL